MEGKPAFDALFEPWYEHSCKPVEPHPHREEVHGVLALQYHDLCQNRRSELGVHQLTDQDYQDMAHVFMHKLYGQPYSHYWHVAANEVGDQNILDLGDTPLVVPPAYEHCPFWTTTMKLLNESSQVQRLSCSEMRLKVIADLWHITTDHSCRDKAPTPAQLEPLHTWLHTADLMMLQTLLSSLANDIEPLLVMKNLPPPTASVSSDEGAD